MTQDGGPAWLTGGEWPSRVWFFVVIVMDPAIPDGPYRMHWFVAAQLWAFGKYPAAVADVLVPNVHKTPSWALSRKEGMGKKSS
jgi:hypothetical protein